VVGGVGVGPRHDLVHQVGLGDVQRGALVGRARPGVDGP
jgi:hypothetical protein